MIKVIKHGQKLFRVICEHCGCEFEYQTEDIDTESLYDLGLPPMTYPRIYRVVKCPDCGHKIFHREFAEDRDSVGDRPDTLLQGQNPLDPFKDEIPCDDPYNHSICEHHSSREDTLTFQ